MSRREIMAIIGAYSRQGINAQKVPGGFMVSAGEWEEGVMQYRTMNEARRDTEIDFTQHYTPRMA